jgi:hypothetical protein
MQRTHVSLVTHTSVALCISHRTPFIIEKGLTNQKALQALHTRIAVEVSLLLQLRVAPQIVDVERFFVVQTLQRTFR